MKTIQSLDVRARADDEPYALVRRLWSAARETGVAPDDDGNPRLSRATRVLQDSLRPVEERSDRHIAQLQYDAISRRLTRHSIEIMADQHVLATALVSAISSKQPDLVVRLTDCGLADRASLRFLAQVIVMARRAGLPEWDLGRTQDDRTPAPESRQRFFRNFAKFTGRALGLTAPDAFAAPADIEVAKRQLVAMNWDPLLAITPECDRSVQYMLHQVFALVNVGEWDTAYQQALALQPHAADANESAHLRYIQGLIETKRMKRPDLGKATFTEGLRHLPAGDGSADAELARGWLLNGLCLANTMLVLQAGHDREQALMGIFEQQADLHRSLGNPQSNYLKYNVLANMAFILELIPRIPAAVTFWQRAFPEARDAISYRVGLLQYKMGTPHEAADSLRAATEAAQKNGNPFQELSAVYALGYVEAHSGTRPQAALRASYNLAVDLNHGQLIGELEGAITPQGDVRDLAALREPDAKQVSYVPWAELDSEDVENLNTYLVRKSRGPR